MSLASPLNRVLTEDWGSAPAPVSSRNSELGECNSELGESHGGVSPMESPAQALARPTMASVVSLVLAFIPAGLAAWPGKPPTLPTGGESPAALHQAVWPQGSEQYLLC